MRVSSPKMHRIRLGIACALFVLGLPIVVPAANSTLWLVTVFVTEWAHWLAVFPLALLIWELRRGCGRWRLPTSLLCLVATCLYCLPLAEAISIAHTLPSALKQAFGAGPQNAGEFPIRIKKLWSWPRPAGVRVEGFHYTTADGTSLALDFYSSMNRGRLPCIVVIHGGAWVIGNEKELTWWDPILAGLGCRVASIAYRLVPKSHWPAQKEDLEAALAYLKAHASELGIDETRFVLLGRSAGGQIALAAAYGLHDPSIKGCIAEYPITDMKFDYALDQAHSIIPTRQVITALMGAGPEAASQLYRDASAMDLAGPDSPPTLLVHGTRDELVWIEDSRRLRDRLVQVRRPVYLLELPWATHGFDANPSGPAGQLDLYAITWFLGSVLHR